MKTIHLNASKSYDILLDYGLINNLPSLIAPFCKNCNVGIITDSIVDELYAESVLEQLKNSGYSVVKFVFPHGEQSKNIQTLSNILEFLAENGFKRNDYLLALGGGVVGDITGLASAIYMRGINFIQVPTTLLSMVDASVGGKTAIDLRAGKNLAGAFWQPSLVVADIDIIKKLPKDIFTEGMAEVLKCNVIDKLGIFETVLTDKLYSELDSVIYKCIKLKQEVVEADEFETNGIRKLLNVGHTFAHSLEKLSNFEISHGFAVGTGLVWEAAIAYKMSLCSLDTFNIIKNAVIHSGLLIKFDYPFDKMVEAMKKDKKNDNDLISFMLPLEVGKCVEKKISETELNNILESIGDLM